MLTRFQKLRLSATILLLVAVICGCGIPKIGWAQDARKGGPTAQAASDVGLVSKVLPPCNRFIPARTKVDGAFTQSTMACHYVFQGVSGEAITIRLTLPDGTTPLTLGLLNPRGTELMAGSTLSATVGSLIDNYRVRETGLHTIVIQANDNSDRSQFRLSIATNTRCGGKISPETIITAQLSEAARYCVYTFVAKADSRWLVETQKLDGGDPPDVDLFDPQGLSLEYTQNSESGRGQIYQLPWDGTYSVFVNAAQISEMGSFELTLLSANEPDPNPVEPGFFTPGQQVRNVYLLQDNRVNLRRTPGHVGKAASDILLDMPGDAIMVILGEAVTVDNLPWWPVRYTDATNTSYTGWVAELTEGGYTILAADE